MGTSAGARADGPGLCRGEAWGGRVLMRLLLCAVLAVAVLVTDSAFADIDIDGAVKSYFVLGGCLAALVFLSIGFFLLSKAIQYRRQAAAAVQWPVAAGTVVAAEVIKRISKSDDELDSYIPRVSYAYAVNGGAYEGNLIRIGLEESGYIREQQARDHLARYPVGATLAVRYDPKKPEIAVLELGQVGAARYLLAGVLLAAVGVGAVVFAIWSATLAVR
jgi:hypothetical protein